MLPELTAYIYTLVPWLVSLLLASIFGLPIIHAVSVTDAAWFTAAHDVQTGGNLSSAQNDASQAIQNGLQIVNDGHILFNPATDVSITSGAPPYETVSVTYHLPIFAPIINVVGLTGPTIPITKSKPIAVSAEDGEGINYLQ